MLRQWETPTCWQSIQGVITGTSETVRHAEPPHDAATKSSRESSEQRKVGQREAIPGTTLLQFSVPLHYYGASYPLVGQCSPKTLSVTMHLRSTHHDSRKSCSTRLQKAGGPSHTGHTTGGEKHLPRVLRRQSSRWLRFALCM